MNSPARGRSRWRVVAGAAAALGVLLAGFTPATASTQDQTQPLANLGSLGNYRLAENPVTIPSSVDTHLPKTTFNTVLNDTSSFRLNLQNPTGCTTSNALPQAPTPPSATDTWCFANADENDPNWAPQGIATSYDFDAGDAMYGSGCCRVIISGWRGPNDQGKLAIVNYSTIPPTYHWVYLAEITGGGSDIADIHSHMSGIAWSSTNLIIPGQKHLNAQGQTALYVFDFNNLRTADTTAPPTGCPALGYCSTDGKWRANGFKYVWLVTDRYTWNLPAGVPDDCKDANTLSARGFCFDSLSLDKSSSPYHIVGSEYFSDPLTSCPSADVCAGMRILRYPIDGTTHRLSSLTPDGGVLTYVSNIQGVAAWGGVYYIARSGGRGALFAGQVGAATHNQCYPNGGGNSSNAECWAGGDAASIGAGTEGLAHDRLNHLMWSQTEGGCATCTPWRKTLFGVPDSTLPNPGA